MIEELGFEPTPLGDLTLRRRSEPRLGGLEVFEVKLGDEYLMSSLFTESERQLATLALTGLEGPLDVAVGGLGLGYTAAAALEFPNLRSLVVIELFGAVIDWHRSGLVPLGLAVSGDPRCELRQGDFFELVRQGLGGRFDAVLLDIDHSPEHHLNKKNGWFYSVEGLTALREQLKPGGVFAFWSNDPAARWFTALLEEVFDSVETHDIRFPNPYTGATSVNSVYIGRR